MEYVHDMNQIDDIEILYEDNHILVVVKPCNILSQGDSTGDKDMITILKRYIKNKYNKPGNVYLGLVHRLDRPVGGIMVFAKSSKAASRLTEMFKKHDFTKKYIAVVEGTFEQKEGTMKNYIRKKENGNSEITDSKDGKYAELNYKVLEENISNNLSLVEIELLTGRHHQIRVQFASRNHCLYGDQRYGKLNGKQIALWAYKLEFLHPVKKECMLFTYFPPKNGVWNLFNVKMQNSSCK